MLVMCVHGDTTCYINHGYTQLATRPKTYSANGNLELDHGWDSPVRKNRHLKLPFAKTHPLHGVIVGLGEVLGPKCVGDTLGVVGMVLQGDVA